ncbi:MAG TPA: hypothetical protein VGK81_08995 [Anaerolineae bacterium]
MQGRYAGLCITYVNALDTLQVEKRLLKIPMSLLIGVSPGLQTQPAALSFALEHSGSDLTNIGIAGATPTALTVRIVRASVTAHVDVICARWIIDGCVRRVHDNLLSEWCVHPG